MIDLRRYRDRLIVAIAIAIALHEVVFGLVHAPARSPDSESEAQTTRIAIEVPRATPTPRPKPTPTPRPTPPPTPEPRVTPPPRSTPAPVQQVAGRAKGTPARRHGGGARKAPASNAKHGTYANPLAAGSGTGTGSGQGSGVAPGTGGGDNGQGTGDTGNGNGGVNADTPCGAVEFRPIAAPHYSGSTAYETIRVTVTFPDGHQERAEFPYKWVYPNGEQTDPWSDTNLRKGEFRIALQTPPPGADLSGYPDLIQYVIKHSDPSGLTVLPDCPKGRE